MILVTGGTGESVEAVYHIGFDDGEAEGLVRRRRRALRLGFDRGDPYL